MEGEVIGEEVIVGTGNWGEIRTWERTEEKGL